MKAKKFNDPLLKFNEIGLVKTNKKKIRSIIIKLMITSNKEKNVKSDQKKQERYNIKWEKKKKDDIKLI